MRKATRHALQPPASGGTGPFAPVFTKRMGLNSISLSDLQRALRAPSFISGLWVAAIALMTGLLMPRVGLTQVSYQIVWVAIGEAASSDGSGAVRAGRQLFDAGELAALSLDSVRVSRVDVEPTLSEIPVGARWCMSSLNIRAFDPDQKLIPEAPLTVTVRQDHRPHIGLKRSRKDICLHPTEAGEYSVRLTSLLPAPDGSMRGAQVFLHVTD